MKAILMPLKGNAARSFEEFANSNVRPKTRRTTKAKRESIIAFINSVNENDSNKNKLCTSRKAR